MGSSADKKYKCVFFDLDHTLWDYDTNAKETLWELYVSYDLPAKGVLDFQKFCDQFKSVNLGLWNLYDLGHITNEVIRTQRFKKILEAFGVDEDTLCENLSQEYMKVCPNKCNLMPSTIETLDYLSLNYNLTVITNGFEEIQNLKLTAGKLHPYFDHIITSQKAGHRKPAKQIFEYALAVNGIQPEEAIMIGDNPVTDVGGALNAAIDAVLFNPENINHNLTGHREIKALQELRELL